MQIWALAQDYSSEVQISEAQKIYNSKAAKVTPSPLRVIPIALNLSMTHRARNQPLKNPAFHFVCQKNTIDINNHIRVWCHYTKSRARNTTHAGKSNTVFQAYISASFPWL